MTKIRFTDNCIVEVRKTVARGPRPQIGARRISGTLRVQF